MATQDQQNNNEHPILSKQTFKVRGMKRDLSESSFENEFAFENNNMRINIIDDDNTLLNLTNERGTLLKASVTGIPIGIKKYDTNKILLVTTEPDEEPLTRKDRFYNIICNEDTITAIQLAFPSGTIVRDDFGFSGYNPLEIEHYKDGDKDFFYIVDGLNNLKTFWIEGNILYSSNNRLDYNSYISGEEKITAKTILKTITQITGIIDNIKPNSLGNFFAGAIVYCFSYITNQGHKTNIIDQSELIYIRSANDKKHGLEPNKKVNISIKIDISGLSDEFEYIELYSLYRSSLNGEITVKKVSKIKIPNNGIISFEDLNNGESISYQELLTRFNSTLIPSTITLKSNALFVGNIKTNNYDILKRDLIDNTGITLEPINPYPDIVGSNESVWNYLIGPIQEYLQYDLVSLNKYYYGIQLQDKFGNWSPTIYVGNGSGVSMHIPSTYVNKAIDDGYVAIRAMIADSKRIHRFKCQGLLTPTISMENGKYGIDYYSNYFLDNDFANDIYGGTNKITFADSKSDLYSPDIEFDENFAIDDSQYNIKLQKIEFYDISTKINIALNGNTGILYNSDNSSNLGKTIYDSTFGYLWYDAITGYQKAVQMQFWKWEDTSGERLDQTDDIYTSLRQVNNVDIHEGATKYKIYTWQPSGSLNDSNGRTSVFRYKQICKIYDYYTSIDSVINSNSTFKLYDQVTNNIPFNNYIYAGAVNMKMYPSTWSIPDPGYHDALWDLDQIPYLDGYILECLDTYKYVGQPIEIIVSLKNNNETKYQIWQYPAIVKGYRETTISNKDKIKVKAWSGDNADVMYAVRLSELAYSSFTQVDTIAVDEAVSGIEKSQNPSVWIKTRVTNCFNRQNAIQIGYKTPKHLVSSYKVANNSNAICTLYDSDYSYNLSNNDIENCQWIVCDRIIINYNMRRNDGLQTIAGISSKTKLVQDTSIIIPLFNDETNFFNYECLKTEPYSVNDENQVFCGFNLYLESYINNLCRYDNAHISVGITSNLINKLNLVYNQKNNFFVFSGITSDTVTDDTLENTILYSDTKVANEKEDTFVNFPITNFFTIDSNINKINKLITFNDKLLCFSDNAIVQILYNENVVINTDSVQSLGLASTDKVTGSQLITNTYGCLNKWSIGIYNNALYFNDDLNKKMMVYNGEFVPLNETLGIETLNSKFFKNTVWNPISFCNTKLNIDKFAKDVHYTGYGYNVDIAFNTILNSFTSFYSYDMIPFMETIGNHSVAFRKLLNGTEIHFLREGDYNYFFGSYEPYSTTVIINQDAIINKTIAFIDFSTEAYGLNNNNSFVPLHNYTFSHVSFWNDYQENKMAINYNMYGKSLLKKKFRVWRINRFRNHNRISNRNYDMISNTWTYLTLSNEVANTNKLTLHWLNVNYK